MKLWASVAEGVTTVSATATDNASNTLRRRPSTADVRIDRTNPTANAPTVGR